MSISFTTAALERLSRDAETPTVVKRALVRNMDGLESTLTSGALAALASFAADEGIDVGSGGLQMFARAGVNAAVLVRLLDRESDSLDVDELLNVLKVMPEEYRKLTSTGRYTDLPNTPENLRIVDRLILATRVTRREEDPRGRTFRVNLRRKLD